MTSPKATGETMRCSQLLRCCARSLSRRFSFLFAASSDFVGCCFVDLKPVVCCFVETHQAFRTGDAEMVKMVLNHKSAEEDCLLQQSSLSKDKKKKSNKGVSSKPINKRAGGSGDGDKAGEEGGDIGGDDDGPSITHELGFGLGESTPEAVSQSSSASSGSGGGSGSNADAGEEDDDEEKRKKRRGKRFLVRELPIRNPDECFGDDAREDTTGLNLWAAAVVLARWVASPAIVSRLEGKTVLELGAGCGAW